MVTWRPGRALPALALVALFLGGCVSNQKIVLLQDMSAERPWRALVDTNLLPKPPAIVLKTGDVIMVRVDHAQLVQDLGQPATEQDLDLYRSVQHPYLIGYTIDPEGLVTLPTLGPVKVEGLSIPDAEKAIQARADDFFSDATVKVVLLNFNISVVGEVNRPGRYPIYENRANVIDGLALAGDLTTLADRSRIRIMRSRDGTNHLYHLNLNDQNILADPHFYLQPDDVVIVDPLLRRKFTGRDPNIVLSILTFLVSIVGVYAALNR
jgi:polysaccharide export outer membrane protein